MSGLNQQVRVNEHVAQSLYASMLARSMDRAEDIGTARAILDLSLRDLRDGDTPNAITMIERAIERLGGKA